LDPSVRTHIASAIEVMSDGQQNNFYLSVDPLLITTNEQIPEKYICFVCKRVPITPVKDTSKSCQQFFCVSCAKKNGKYTTNCLKCGYFFDRLDDTPFMSDDMKVYNKMIFKCERERCNESYTLNSYVDHMK
jgi:hypothetical protein